MGVRFIWMTGQARLAIRKKLEITDAVQWTFRRISVWRDCGSIWDASRLLILDYEVKGRLRNGGERTYWFEVEFVPVVGRLRRVRMVEPEPVPASNI